MLERGSHWQQDAGQVGRLARAFAGRAGHRGILALALVAAGALLEGAGLILLVPLVGVIVGQGVGIAVPSWFAGLNNPAALIALFVGVMCLRALTLRARDLLLFELQVDFVESLRSRVVRTLAAARWDRLAKLDHARISSLIASDIPRLSVASHYLVQLMAAAAMLTAQMALAIALGPWAALAALAALAGGVIVLSLMRGSAGAMGHEIVRANHALLGSAASLLGGLKASSAQGAGGAFADTFDAAQRLLSDGQRQFMRRQADARTLLGIGAAIAGAGLISGGIALDIPAPTLVALAVIFARMAPLVQQLQQGVQQLAYNAPGYAEIRAIEQALQPYPAMATGLPRPTDGGLELEGVGYRHPGGGGIEDATFRILPGEIVGISGTSGSGKTTLLDLMAGLLRPQEGVVWVEGRVLEGWGDALGYVPQDAFLIHGTIRQNLGWGASDIADADMEAALRVAGADMLLARLQQGLDAIVGERGGLLSGGERQRIAIARAILHRPRLLILDEATAAIDPAGEAQLIANLRALDPRPTILLVAHRTESLARCDRIIRVEQGRIAVDQMTSISAL